MTVAELSPVLARLDRWTRAKAAYWQATDHYRAVCSAHSDIEEAYFRQRPDRPDFTLEIEGDYGRFGKHVLPVTISHDELDDPDRQWKDPAKIVEMRTELAAYRLADAELRASVGYEKSKAAEQAASQRQTRALGRLVATRTPDLAALTEKLTIILAEYDDSDGNIAALTADIAALEKAYA